jgi:hypothetical protein
MAINFQQVFDKVKRIGLEARAHRETLEAKRQTTRDLLETWAGKTVELRSKVEQARQADPSLRCAIPLDERLDTCHPEPAVQNPAMLLAADGSQILPDRHAPVQYSLVNVGAIVLEPGSRKAPRISTDSSLLFAEELYTETGTLTGEAIEQRRDIAERRKLLELAGQVEGPQVALTDGPVELWGAKGGDPEDYRRNLEIHKSVLSQLQEKNVIVAGYVDKPGADLVIRTLEIAALSENELKDVRTKHNLRSVSDRWLFGENKLLMAGQRSAVFGLQSSSRAHYTGNLALHFFYLNVGDEKHPALVRVECPKWVADDTEKLDLLHAALLQQCRVMGAKPYPYILHRAHEIAVVKFEEKQQVEQMLEIELRRAGGEVEDESGKSSSHGLQGRSKRK